MVVLLASLTAAAAQNSAAPPAAPSPDAAATDPESTDAAEAADDDQAVTQDAEPLSEEQAAAMRDAINDALNSRYDAESAGGSRFNPAGSSGTAALDWDRTAKSNGSTYTVKRTLPVDWNAKIGADLNDADGTRSEPTPPALATPAKNTGAAWANVQVPSVASFDARVGAGSEPSKFSMSRTVPLGSMTSLTVQNSYAETSTAPASPGTGSVWSNDRQVKFNIASTGTTLGAGNSSSSADGVTHSRFSAEQKLFDKFNVTTTFSDLGTPAASRSITAGLKTQW